jgi:hypothetical protein
VLTILNSNVTTSGNGAAGLAESISAPVDILISAHSTINTTGSAASGVLYSAAHWPLARRIHINLLRNSALAGAIQNATNVTIETGCQWDMNRLEIST